MMRILFLAGISTSLAAMHPTIEVLPFKRPDPKYIVASFKKEFAALKAADEQTREAIASDLRRKTFRTTLLAAHHFDHPTMQKAEDSGINAIVVCGGSTLITQAATSIALNKSGNTLAAAFQKRIEIFRKNEENAWQHDVTANISPCSNPVNSLAFQDESNLLSADHENIYLLNLATKEHSWAKHENISSCIVSHDGNWFAQVSMEDDKPFIAISKGMEESALQIFTSETFSLRQLALDARGDKGILSTSNQLAIMKLKGNDEIHLFDLIPQDIDMSADGMYGVAVIDGALNIFNMDIFFDVTNTRLNAQQISSTSEHAITAARFAPHDSSQILVAEGKTVRSHNHRTGTHGYVFCVSYPIKSLAVSGDGQTVAAASDRATYILDGSQIDKKLTPEHRLLMYKSELSADAREPLAQTQEFKEIYATLPFKKEFAQRIDLNLP